MSPRDLALAPMRLWWRLLVIEVRGVVGLARGIVRRPDVPPGTTAIPYARGRWAAPALFGFAALAELLAIDMLVPWERFGRYAGTRWLALILGAYGVLWVAIYVVGQHMSPHLMRRDEVLIRNTHLEVVRIPRDALVAVHVRPLRDVEGNRVVMSDPLAPANLDLDFDRPLPIHGWLGGVKKHADKIAVIVDEPRDVARQLQAWAGVDARRGSAADR